MLPSARSTRKHKSARSQVGAEARQRTEIRHVYTCTHSPKNLRQEWSFQSGWERRPGTPIEPSTRISLNMESSTNNRLYNIIQFNILPSVFTQVHTSLSFGGFGFPPQV